MGDDRERAARLRYRGLVAKRRGRKRCVDSQYVEALSDIRADNERSRILCYSGRLRKVLSISLDITKRLAIIKVEINRSSKVAKATIERLTDVEEAVETTWSEMCAHIRERCVK